MEYFCQYKSGLGRRDCKSASYNYCSGIYIVLDVNNKEYDYQMGVYYMDIIAECEKLGDYVVNVVEASSDVKEKRAS